jgi:hypothetical protein
VFAVALVLLQYLCEYKAVIVAEYVVTVDNKMLGIKAVADWQIPFFTVEVGVVCSGAINQ